ncbi:MAG: hypothetical protein WDO06_02275 [Actinomycetota bacterium]
MRSQLLLRVKRPQAHVVAVESDPLALEYLKKNVESQRWTSTHNS